MSNDWNIKLHLVIWRKKLWSHYIRQFLTDFCQTTLSRTYISTVLPKEAGENQILQDRKGKKYLFFQSKLVYLKNMQGTTESSEWFHIDSNWVSVTPLCHLGSKPSKGSSDKKMAGRGLLLGCTVDIIE